MSSSTHCPQSPRRTYGFVLLTYLPIIHIIYIQYCTYLPEIESLELDTMTPFGVPPRGLKFQEIGLVKNGRYYQVFRDKNFLFEIKSQNLRVIGLFKMKIVDPKIFYDYLPAYIFFKLYVQLRNVSDLVTTKIQSQISTLKNQKWSKGENEEKLWNEKI